MSDDGRKPGPQTAAARARCGLPRQTHGLRRFLKTGLLPLRRQCPLQPCTCGPGRDADSICPVLERARRERIFMVSALPWIKPHHADLVAEFVGDVIMLKVIDAWVTKAGMVTVDGDVDLCAVLHRRWTIAAAMVRLADRLGLTPAAQKELGLDDALDVGGDLLAQLRQEAQPVKEDGE